ncbi:MAG: glycogen/starch synthase [Patescibacteria group bacterium]|jgi:starch synthase
MKHSLKIVSVSSEVDPFSKTGGLADVARSLPKALRKLNHDVIIVTPLHGVIQDKKFKLELLQKDVPVYIDKSTTIKADFWKSSLSTGVPVYFIDHPRFFSSHKKVYGSKTENLRFYFFNVAVFELLKFLNFRPDVIQAHEWHTGLIPFLLRTRFADDPLFKQTGSLFTIHNLAFQMGKNWWELKPREKDDGNTKLPLFKEKGAIENINYAKRGIVNADIINTVSEQYAQEIMTKKYGQALHRILLNRKENLFGIVNGIDYNDFNPATDPGLYKNYDFNSLHLKTKNKLHLQKMFQLPEDPKIPLIGVVSRITEQKGFDLIFDIMDPLMRQDVQVVILGGGEKKYESFFKKLIRKYPKKVAAHLQFNSQHATKVYAGSDMFLMPSRFEPCGLGQMISLRYGSIPIVRATGGLADTITNYNPRTQKGNGFTFKTYDSRDLLVAITRAIENHKHREEWIELIKKSMQLSFSWKIPAKKYELLYKKAIKNKQLYLVNKE